jgi:hypothetical protein
MHDSDNISISLDCNVTIPFNSDFIRLTFAALVVVAFVVVAITGNNGDFSPGVKHVGMLGIEKKAAADQASHLVTMSAELEGKLKEAWKETQAVQEELGSCKGPNRETRGRKGGRCGTSQGGCLSQQQNHASGQGRRKINCFVVGKDNGGG